MPATLDENMAAYDAMRGQLEAEYHGKWVVFYDQELVGSYDWSDEACMEAVQRFGRGPYHIRQVGVRQVLWLPFIGRA